MSKDNLEQINTLAELFGTDRLLKKNDLDAVLKAVLAILANNKREVGETSEGFKQQANDLFEKIADAQYRLQQQVDEKVGMSKVEIDEKVRNLMQEFKTLAEEIKAIVPKDGKDADEEKVISAVLAKIKFPEPKEFIPDSPEQIVDKLRNFKDAWVELRQVKGLQELLSENGRNILQQVRGFIPNALASLYDVEIKNPIDGQAMVWNAEKRKWIAGAVVSSSVGTGFTKLTATGTVNGTNADFTFTEKPTYIVSDGTWYEENAGWTWTAGTLTATMSVPPQTGIWGFV